jgi:shikimate dehydrogenase
MKFGLIGKSLKHSFSQSYFTEKFKAEGLAQHSYQNFELGSIGELVALKHNHPKLKGLNVTFPYKEVVLPFLKSLSADAQAIGAVNTIALKNGELHGYNTDWQGFMKSVDPLLSIHHQRCLVLGSGGAAKAVGYALEQLGMTYLLVSRSPKGSNEVGYLEASTLLADHRVLINTTPLGTFPEVNSRPPIELGNLSKEHLVYDLIYNPEKSLLLKEAEIKGAQIANGLKMLELQAELSWRIWNEF